jgi:hypothetical protein
MDNGSVHRAVVLLPFRGTKSFRRLKAASAAMLNLGRLKYGGESSTSFDDTACFLLGFDQVQIEQIVDSFKRHGVPVEVYC